MNYEDKFENEMDKFRFRIAEEIYRPVFPLEGRISEDGQMIILNGEDLRDCYGYWVQFLLLQPLAPIFKELKIDKLNPNALALLTKYVSVKLQNQVKDQIKNTDLLKTLIFDFVQDEEVKQILEND